MEVLYILNLTVAFLLLLWPLWFSTRRLRLPVLNPFTIVMATTLPVDLMKLFGGPTLLIAGGLFDEDFQFAVLMGSLLLVCQTAGLLFFFKLFRELRIDKNLPFKTIDLKPKELRRSARFFFVIFLIAFYLLASAEFGLSNWLANPREGYQLYRTGQGHWYALAITALSVSYLLSCLGKPTTRHIILTTVVYVAVGYFLGSKGVLLGIFTAMLNLLWFLKSPALKKIIVFGTPLIFGLMIWNLSLAMAGGIALQDILEYFDYYKNGADYYQAYFAHQLPLFHGDVMMGSIWNYVPRGFYPDKPVSYGILLINDYFYPGQAELTNTPAFGGAVAEFADFGVIGVFIFGFFNAQSALTAACSYLIYRRPGLNFSKVTLGAVLLLLVQYAPGFGTFFPGALYLALLLVTLTIVRLLRSSRMRRRLRAGAPSMSTGNQEPPLSVR